MSELHQQSLEVFTSKTIKQITAQMNDFVTAKGWYAKSSTRQQTPRNLAISLTLETAEVLEHFQWSDTVPGKGTQELGDELADVALYLFQLADVSGIDLEEAIQRKLAFNYSREWAE